jgi:hypothetical protein
MFKVVLGCAMLLATALAFWSMRPVDGKVRSWIAPALEPYIAVALVLGLGVGLVMIFIGSISP